MYDFHCNYVQKGYGNKVKLLFTDTMQFNTKKTNLVHDNICKDKGKFDLSNYPKNSKVYDERSEMIIGKMKSKGKGFPIVQFVGLKRYIEDDNGDKKAKGIKTSHT